MVVLDGVVQRVFVLDVIFLSVIIVPPHLEGTRSELEAFLNLKGECSVRKVRRRGEDRTLALSSSQEQSRAESNARFWRRVL